MMMQTDNFALFTKEVKIGITLSKRYILLGISDYSNITKKDGF